jgi:formylglycine-generating enzyme required for sulfatase activity
MIKLFVVLGVIALTSFSGASKPTFEISNLKRNFEKIKENFYVSKFEVSNVEYRNFLADLLNNNKLEIYKNCLPDTACWKEKLNYSEPFVKYYFRYPRYDNYPVVGVSYEAANEYCKWLTEKYNQYSRYKKVQIKLLSKEEWTFAANKGDASKVYTWGSGFMQNNRKQYLCNFKHASYVFDSLTKKYDEIPDINDESLARKTITTASINSYFPNSFGLYNMCGNVAEMIEEKGIAKGGSFDEYANGVRIASEKSYTRPQADIGFRIAIKITEN